MRIPGVKNAPEIFEAVSRLFGIALKLILETHWNKTKPKPFAMTRMKMDCHLNLRLGRLSLSLLTLLLSKNPHQKLCDHVLSPFERSLGIFLLKAVVLNNRAPGQF